jgi:polyisoprenoid-binding protein YceI
VSSLDSAPASNLSTRLGSGSLAGVWVLDPTRSSLEVTTRAMFGLVGVKVRFRFASGGTDISPTGEVSGRLQIATDSLRTGIWLRDRHLRSEHFFGTRSHPTALYEIHGVETLAATATVHGSLTIRGRRRSVPVSVLVTKLNGYEAALEVSTNVDRSDFGITHNKLGANEMRNEIAARVVFTRR